MGVIVGGAVTVGVYVAVGGTTFIVDVGVDVVEAATPPQEEPHREDHDDHNPMATSAARETGSGR